mmetsp:Transcript_61974/g.174696  ORF Transcript_61974/g.174696 Transcript_61974/m.174696 type:complete len:425 (-) Transcript_61974:102-1376(-)
MATVAWRRVLQPPPLLLLPLLLLPLLLLLARPALLLLRGPGQAVGGAAAGFLLPLGGPWLRGGGGSILPFALLPGGGALAVQHVRVHPGTSSGTPPLGAVARMPVVAAPALLDRRTVSGLMPRVPMAPGAAGKRQARLSMARPPTATAASAAAGGDGGGDDDDTAGDGGDRDVASMTVRELRTELQRYQIPTEAFFEKSELAEALGKARAGGLPPSPSSSAPAPASGPAPAAAASRDERLREETEKAEKMGVAELKRQLEEAGIPTASFLEKSEFVKALASTRAGDGYAVIDDVEVITDGSAGPRPKQGEEAGRGEPPPPWAGAAGGSPFGGAAGGSPFGVGGPPFAGANMFQDMLSDPKVTAQIQAMMNNPKLLGVFQKAQSNPRIMQIMRECVANPANLAKYAGDPEFSEAVRELKDAMGGR